MSPSDWEACQRDLDKLSAGELSYWGPTLERLKALETLDPDYVEQRLQEFRQRLEATPAAVVSPSQHSQQLMEIALEQLRRLLRGGEFDQLAGKDQNQAQNRAQIWRKLAALAQEPTARQLRAKPNPWVQLTPSDWQRLHYIQATLVGLTGDQPQLARELCLEFATVLQQSGKVLKQNLKSLEQRCQRAP